MRLLLSHVALAVTIAQMGYALPQASTNSEAVGHIVILKAGLNKDHLDEHLESIKAIQKRSKRDDIGDIGVKHVVDGASYGFQGYTGKFTPEMLEHIKAHEHVDYVEEDQIVSQLPVESREVSAEVLVVMDDADADTSRTRPTPNIGGTLSWGQGYNTLLGMGRRVGVVVPLSEKAKRNNATVLDETNPAIALNETDPATAFQFTAPGADLKGVDLEDYFAPPDLDAIFASVSDALEAPEEDDEANEKRAVVNKPGCAGKIQAHMRLVEDYDSYIHALDISASTTISGWGQSASVSGSYLDQAKMTNNALTFVATIEVENQQDYESGRFNTASYVPAQFHQTHGDRWVKGYRKGGRLMARLIFRSKESSSTNEIKAHAEAALRFWGISGDISADVKKSMEEVSKHADVDINVFLEGNLGIFLTGTNSATAGHNGIGSASGSFEQVKQWADDFMQQACTHNFAYRPVLEEYITTPGFPIDQHVHDYSIARIWSNRVLRELVKASELVTAVTRRLEALEGWDEHIHDMDFEFVEIVAKSKSWVDDAATRGDTETWSQITTVTVGSKARHLMEQFSWFFRTYRKYLSPSFKDMNPDAFNVRWFTPGLPYVHELVPGVDDESPFDREALRKLTTYDH